MNIISLTSLVVAVLCVYSVAGQGVDQTLRELAYGKDVTEACLRKIQRSGIFSDDQSFLRRLAWVESQFGDSNATYRANYHGGIWQLDEHLYDRISNASSLNGQYLSIAETFSISWTNTTWRDNLKPFYSALGARLYLQNLNLTIPGTIEAQADFWIAHYRPDGKNRTEWVDKVRELESEPVCSSSMDICMVLDGSGSIGQSNFNLAKSFVADAAVLMRNLSSNANSTRVSLVLYSSTAEVYFDFANNLTLSEMNNTIRGIFYTGGGTNTTGGLFTAVDLHNAASPRPGVPKVVATFTDGANGAANLTQAIETVRNASLQSFAVGIGPAINLAELRQIALDDPSRVYSVAGYNALSEFVYRLNSETCELPQEPEVGDNRTDSCQRNEFKYYAYLIPSNGLTIRLDVTLGSLNGWYSFTEQTPNSAVYDGVIVDGWAFVAPRSRQQGGGDKVYVSVQGAEDVNEFVISTDAGNLVSTESTEPSKPASGNGISNSLILSFILLLATRFV